MVAGSSLAGKGKRLQHLGGGEHLYAFIRCHGCVLASPGISLESIGPHSAFRSPLSLAVFPGRWCPCTAEVNIVRRAMLYKSDPDQAYTEDSPSRGRGL